MTGDTERRARGERLYRTLLRLYPADFRELYGEMMVDFYRARMGEGDRAICLKLYADVVAHGIRERISPLPRRNPDFSTQAHPTGDGQMLSNLRQDLSYALRNLRRAPAFTATILITLALGIGANVAIFSVVSGVLLRPLPFADAERVIQLSNGNSPSMLSEPEVVDLTRDARSFARIGAYSYADGNVTGGQEAERVRIARVSAGFFQTLSPTPYLGRVFTTEEDAAGAGDVVIISYGLWQRRFGMDAAAIGKQLVLNGTPRTVVGVMPAHLDYPTDAVAVWLPIRLDRETTFTRNRNNHYLRLIARLAPGVTLERADAEVRALRDRWTRDFPNNYKPSDALQVDVRPIRDRVVGAAQPYLVALLGAVGFVLLIACVNVANLLLARGEVRRKEMMIRSALGAKRGRIAMQLSLESAILTFGGGLLGVAVAYPALRMIVAAAPGSIPRVGEIRLDVHALLFAAIVCLVTGVMFALVPIVRGANVGVLTALNSGSRNAVQSGGRGARRTRGFLVASEVALAVMMLAGAGLFVRTLMNLRRTDLGFASSEVLTVRLSLPRPAYSGEKGAAFVAALVERVRAMPGVTHAAAMAWLPIVDGGGNWAIIADGAPATGDTPTAEPQQITPNFFASLSIPVLRGRDISDADRATTEPVVVVNQALAKRLWQTDDVLGRKFRLSTAGMPSMTVVGVVANTRVDGLTEPAPPIMYFPHQQAAVTGYFTALSMSLVVRASAASFEAIVPAIKQAVRALDTNVPVSEIRTIGDIVSSSIARHRFTALLLSGLAGFAVLLAAIGIYGVVAYSVSQRRYELGVRMALGAGRGRVLSLVLREGLGVVIVGLVVGLAGVVVLGQVLASVLVGIGSLDASTLVAVSALLLGVAVLALVLPARRAASIDPTEALRNG